MGWWGEDPPYHYPVFILTHHPRDPVEMEGGTTFHFVTDGIESALDRATRAAGGKDVMLWGGAQVANQYLAAGLLDEFELHVVPVLLGDGARLFDDCGDAEVRRRCRGAISFHVHLRRRRFGRCRVSSATQFAVVREKLKRK